jgi:cell shape-determining protein MreC
MAWILYFARSVSSTLTIYGKDRAMKKAKHTVADLEHRVQELEAENARLKDTLPPPSEIPHHTLS